MARTDDGLDVATLRRLHELTARINGCATLAETLQAVVDGVVEVVGFDAAVLNRRMPNGEFEVVAAAGPAEMCAQLLGTRYPADTWEADLAVAEHWGTLRFIPADRVPESTVDIMWIPDLEPTHDPDKWHANDLLYAPLSAPSGDLVGMLSVDLPRGGRRPGPEQRDLLQMFAAQAGTAVDNARLTEQLRTSEEAFRLAFESAGTGMAVLDSVRRSRHPVLPGQPGPVPDPRADPGGRGVDPAPRRHPRGRSRDRRTGRRGAVQRRPRRETTRGALAAAERHGGVGGAHAVGRTPR